MGTAAGRGAVAGKLGGVGGWREEELGSVGGAIHGVEVDARPRIQHLLPMPARYDGLQLLDIGDTHEIREVRLLHHGLHEAHPLLVVVLAGQVEQDTEGEVQVVRLTQPSLVPQANQGTLLKYFDFSLVTQQ